MNAELLLDAQAGLGEGPVWDERARRLIWVDIMAGHVHCLDPRTGSQNTLETGEPVGAAGLRESGGLVLALQSGFALVDAEWTLVRRCASFPQASPALRMNDGKCDPAGRFWAGTMAFDFRPCAGALYRLDPAGGVHLVLEGVTISNGIDWAPGGAAMYYADTPTRRVDLFDFNLEAGAISNRRPFAVVEEGAGWPDGLTVDGDGNVWVALWGGSAVRCYSPAGKLEEVVTAPASQTSSCCFGGDGYSDLYITTARGGIADNELAAQPLAGGIFVARPGARGRPCFRFAG